VIVVDDASSDETHAVVEAVQTMALTYVRHQTNLGPAAARNSALRRARGTYVALLDADDRMRPRNLERKVAVLEAHPEVALVHSAAIAVDAEGRPLRSSHLRADGAVILHNLFPEILERNPIITSSVVARKIALSEAGGFDSSLRYIDDWVMWMRLARSHPFAFIPEQLVDHRIDDGSLQWRSFATGRDVAETEKILSRMFTDFDLCSRGLSLERMCARQYYRKLCNKADVLPLPSVFSLYMHAIRRYPREAFSRVGLRASVKVVAAAVVPQSILRRQRIRRHARRLEAGRFRKSAFAMDRRAWWTEHP
jgi:glycosyltransferase involved in cell wall biosynthesis